MEPDSKLARLTAVSARIRADHRDLRIWTDCLLRDFARELQHAVEQVSAATGGNDEQQALSVSDTVCHIPSGPPGVPLPVTMSTQVPSLQVPEHSLAGSRSPSLGTSMTAITPSHRGSVQLQPVASIVVFNRPLSARRKESAAPDSAVATTAPAEAAPSGNDRSETAVFQEKEGRHTHLSSSGSSNLSPEITVEVATDANKNASNDASTNAVGSAVYLWDIFRTADGRSGQYLLDEIDEEDEALSSHQVSYEEGADGKSSEGAQTPSEGPPLEIVTMDGEGENGGSEDGEEINLEQFVLNQGCSESTEMNDASGGEGDGKGGKVDKAAFSIRTATQLLRWKTRSTERISMATVYKHMQERFVSKLESGDLVLQAGSMSELQHIPVQLQANPAFYTPEMLAKRSEIRGSLETRSILRSLWGLLPRKESSKSMDRAGAGPGDGADLAASLNSKGKHPSKPTPPTSSGNKAVAARVSAIVAAKNAEKDHQKKKQPTAHQDDSEVVDPLSQTHITFNTYCAIAAYLFRRLLPQGTLREFAAVLKEDWAKESGSDTATTMDYKHFSDAMFETIDVWCPTMNPNDYSIFAEYVLRPVCTKAAKHDPDKPFRIGKLWKSKKKAYYGPILQTARRAKAWNGEPIPDDTEGKEDEDDVEDDEDLKLVAMTTGSAGSAAKRPGGNPLGSVTDKSTKPSATTLSGAGSPAMSERSNSEAHAQAQHHPLPKSNTPPPGAGDRTSSRSGTRSTTPKSGGVAPLHPRGPARDGVTAVPMPTAASTLAANEESNGNPAVTEDAITTTADPPPPPVPQQSYETTSSREVSEDSAPHALGQPANPAGATAEAPLLTEQWTTDGPTAPQEDAAKNDLQREEEDRRMSTNRDAPLLMDGAEPPTELTQPAPPLPFPGDSINGDLRPTTTVGSDRGKQPMHNGMMNSTGASGGGPTASTAGSWVSIPGKGKYASRTAPLSSTGMMLANSGSSFLPPSVYFVSNMTFGRPDEANAVAAPSSWALPALLPHSAALHNHQLEGTALAGAGGPGGSRRSPTKGKLKIGPVSRTSIIPGVLSMQAAQELQGHSAETGGEGAERPPLPSAVERQQHHQGDEIERFATGGTTIPSLSESENRVAKNHPEKALRVLPSVGVSARQSPPRRHPGAAATVPVERTQPTFDSHGGSADSRNLYVGLPPSGVGSGGSAHSPDRDAVGGVAPAPPPPGSRQGLRGAGSPKRARPLPSSLSNSRTDTQNATPIRPQTQGGVPAPNSEPLNRARAKELHLIMRKVTSSESGGSARKPVAGTRAHAMQLTPRPPTRDRVTISQRGEAMQQQ